MQTDQARLNLGGDEAHLWFADPREMGDAAWSRGGAAWLSEEERERMGRFRFAAHRHLFLLSHALTRAVLSRYAPLAPEEWRFTRTPHGRPEIANAGAPPLRFSLAHCADLVVLGVTLEADIGVDAESAARGVPAAAVARQCFAEAEYRDWLARPPERFFEYWTLKEAYLKARGLGLSVPARHVAFRLDEPEGVGVDFHRDLEDDPGAWSFWRFRPGGGRHAALALRGRRRVTCWSAAPPP